MANMIINLMNLNKENGLNNNDYDEPYKKANLSEQGDFDNVGDDKSENDDIDQLSTPLLAEKNYSNIHYI